MTEPSSEYVNGPIEIVDYNAKWPRQFETEAACIRNALRHKTVGIEHVGSTAIRICR